MYKKTRKTAHFAVSCHSIFLFTKQQE